MPRDTELPTIDLSTLSRVTGGANTDMSSMLMPLMMMKSRQQQAAPAAAPVAAAPTTPQITLNGVPQTPSSSSATGTNYAMPADMFGDDSSSY